MFRYVFSIYIKKYGITTSWKTRLINKLLHRFQMSKNNNKITKITLTNLTKWFIKKGSVEQHNYSSKGGTISFNIPRTTTAPSFAKIDSNNLLNSALALSNACLATFNGFFASL